MSKFNTGSKVYTNAANLAGGNAISMNPEMELTHAVLTTFLEDKFYESGDARLKRIQALVKQCSPQFVAKLAIVARKEFNLRSVSHALLGELAKIHRGDSLVKDAIVDAAIRVDDLMEIAAYVGSPMPKQVKRGIRNAILKFDAYQLAKYKGEGKSITLVDLFNLTHPKVQHANAEQKKAWAALVEGKLASFDTWETEISNAKDDAARTKAWEDLIAEDKLGYMALLRNLNNFIKYGVSEKAIEKVVTKLSNPDEVKKSKQLPFRFVTAYKNVSGNRKFATAISDAMEVAVSNVPTLSGTTLIAIDCSGSMSGDPIQKAAIFGAALVKSNPNADVILYSTEVMEPIGFSSRTPIIDITASIERQAMGGGTQTSLVFDYAMVKNRRYDRIIIISDNESWSEGYSDSVQGHYKAYTKWGANPFVYAIDIQGYGTKDIDGGRVFHLTGWSDRILDFIGHVEEGNTLIDHIKDYEIPHKENKMQKVTKVAKKLAKRKK